MEYKIKRKTVTSPKKLCLYNPDRIEDTIEFFNEIESLSNNPNYAVTIDLSDLKYINSATATYLFALVSAMQAYVSIDYFKITQPKNKELKRVFSDTGLHTALKPGGKSKLKKLWKNSNFLCGNNNDRAKFLAEIRKRLDLNALPPKLITAIKETLLNIHHHAYQGPTKLLDYTWWCYFQIRKDDKGSYLSAVILDRGSGIPFNIRNELPLFEHQSDSACLKHAMTEFVTTTKEKGRGRGSKDIQSPIYSNKNDVLLIISDKVSYAYYDETIQNGKTTLDLTQAFKGTLVEWKLYY
ncbi:hypothetical protein [Thalassotalea sp. PLHSN55]|uniref:hypothetical protein n=1 Tax=Thalassotalea sp. PLHSN55 TaxID=3435888 RepID=UPI003F8638FC